MIDWTCKSPRWIDWEITARAHDFIENSSRAAQFRFKLFPSGKLLFVLERRLLSICGFDVTSFVRNDAVYRFTALKVKKALTKKTFRDRSALISPLMAKPRFASTDNKLIKVRADRVSLHERHFVICLEISLCKLRIFHDLTHPSTHWGTKKLQALYQPSQTEDFPSEVESFNEICLKAECFAQVNSKLYDSSQDETIHSIRSLESRSTREMKTWENFLKREGWARKINSAHPKETLRYHNFGFSKRFAKFTSGFGNDKTFFSTLTRHLGSLLFSPEKSTTKSGSSCVGISMSKAVVCSCLYVHLNFPCFSFSFRFPPSKTKHQIVTSAYSL